MGVQCRQTRQQYRRQCWLVQGIAAIAGTVLKTAAVRIWQELHRSRLAVRSEGSQLYLRHCLNLLPGLHHRHGRPHDLPQTCLRGD